jgi:ABC-type uncharacterized transport system substrate-binding protein
MKRREFITLLGGVAAAWPLAVRAQRGATPVIGYLSLRSPDAERPLLVPFLQSLEKSGFADGRNIAMEYRFADGREARLPNFAAELLNRQVSLLVAFSRHAALAAKAATSTVPIVFATGFDPVFDGLVTSLNRPGGNATGISAFSTELGPKRLTLLGTCAERRHDRFRCRSKQQHDGVPGQRNAGGCARCRTIDADCAGGQ